MGSSVGAQNLSSFTLCPLTEREVCIVLSPQASGSNRGGGGAEQDRGQEQEEEAPLQEEGKEEQEDQGKGQEDQGDSEAQVDPVFYFVGGPTDRDGNLRESGSTELSQTGQLIVHLCEELLGQMGYSGKYGPWGQDPEEALQNGVKVVLEEAMGKSTELVDQCAALVDFLSAWKDEHVRWSLEQDGDDDLPLARNKRLDQLFYSIIRKTCLLGVAKWRARGLERAAREGAGGGGESEKEEVVEEKDDDEEVEEEDDDVQPELLSQQQGSEADKSATGGLGASQTMVRASGLSVSGVTRLRIVGYLLA